MLSHAVYGYNDSQKNKNISIALTISFDNTIDYKCEYFFNKYFKYRSNEIKSKIL